MGTVMHNTYLQHYADAVGLAVGEFTVDGKQRGREKGLRAHREWAENPQREYRAQLERLTRDLLTAREHSSAAGNTARAFCISCRCLSATQGQCCGQSMNRCLLLKNATQ